MHTEAITDILLNTSRNPVVILDEKFSIRKTNNHIHKNFTLLEPQSEGKPFYEILQSVWKTPEMENLLSNILPLEKAVKRFPVQLSHQQKSVDVLVDAHYFTAASSNEAFFCLIIENAPKSESLVPDTGNIQSDELLNSVLHTGYYGIALYQPVFDPDHKITDFKIVFTNEEVPGNFGLSVDEVLGKNCSEVYPGVFSNGIFEKMVHCHTSRQPEKYEVEAKAPDGTALCLEAAIEYVNNMVAVSSRNCTIDKQASVQLNNMNTFLAESNKQLEQLILNEFSDSFTTFLTGKDFFDFVLTELVQKTGIDCAMIGEVLPIADPQTIRTLSVCKSGNIVENFNYGSKNGPCAKIVAGQSLVVASGILNTYPKSELLSQLNASGYIAHPLHDSAGNYFGLICVTHSQTIEEPEYIESLVKIAAKRCEMECNRQMTERLLASKNEELEKQNQDLASFTYIASHDLQEPLRKIRMFNSRIIEKDQKNLTPDSLNYLSSINATAGRMQNLIDALLSYSSMDSDDLKKEKANLNTVLKDVMAMMDDVLEEKNVVIKSDGKLPSIYILPLQFQQMLYNIISNAVKYAKVEVSPEIEITANKVVVNKIGYWKIDISDNGIGFDPQYKERIFEVFQRLHGKKEYAGTGVGLAICKKIALSHNGFIEAEGKPGVGSVFSIFIPEKK